MVAYNFKAQFVQAIREGRKRQTIRKERAGRARHARAGDSLTLLTGPRFKPVRIGTATCEACCPIRLHFQNGVDGGSVTLTAPPLRFHVPATVPSKVSVGVVMSGAGPLDFFARADGFESWSAMEAFWRDVHAQRHGGPAFVWSGVAIFWQGFRDGV